MTQKITDRVQRDSALNEARGKVMAQIVPAKTGDRCALAAFPTRSEILWLRQRGAFEILTCSRQRRSALMASSFQRHMTGLAILGIPALDGEEPTVEIHGTPTQLENLTAPQSRVHR